MNNKKIRKKIIYSELENLFKTRDFRDIFLSDTIETYKYDKNTKIRINFNEGIFSINLKILLDFGMYADYINITPFNLMYYKIIRFCSKKRAEEKNKEFLNDLKKLPDHIKTKLNMNIL